MPSKSKAYSMMTPTTLLDLVLFGERLKTARLRRNWKLSKVSDMSGVSLSTLKKIEAGDPHVPIGMVAQLCDCYQLGSQWQHLADLDKDHVGQSMETPNVRRRARDGQSPELEFDV
jgi:transcriptional regulator with XRE-family HTH domain